ELVLHGRESGRINRTAEGRFFEAHEPLTDFERWPLVSFEEQAPLELDGHDGHGIPRSDARRDKIRERLSRFYFSDRIAPVTPAKLAAVHHDHDGEEHEALTPHSTTWTGHMHGGAEERALDDAYTHQSDR
ncbi:MAG TPA: hypothetical protein VFJ12_05550, partial [Segeticoccus sp.]|nr:hypothetical protein [Segeticoccus sp.]